MHFCNEVVAIDPRLINAPNKQEFHGGEAAGRAININLAEVGRAQRVAACFADKRGHIVGYFEFGLTAGVLTIAFRTRIARCGFLQWLFQHARASQRQFFAHFCGPLNHRLFKHQALIKNISPVFRHSREMFGVVLPKTDFFHTPIMRRTHRFKFGQGNNMQILFPDFMRHSRRAH